MTVLRDLRQRMDVRFCEGRNQPPRGTVRAANSGRFAVRAPPKRASGELCFPLTKTYMDDGPPGPETANGCPVLRRQEPTAERHRARCELWQVRRARSSEARVRRTLFPLDKDLHGGRPTGSYHCSDAAWPASTVEIQFRAPLQAHWRRRPGRIAGF